MEVTELGITTFLIAVPGKASSLTVFRAEGRITQEDGYRPARMSFSSRPSLQSVWSP